MSKVWVVIRVMKWAALGLFLFVLAFAPWGWTGVLAVLAVIAAWRLRKRLARPPGKHAAHQHAHAIPYGRNVGYPREHAHF